MGNFTHINISLTEKLKARIDKQKGEISRSRFIVRLLEQAMNLPEKERTKY